MPLHMAGSSATPCTPWATLERIDPVRAHELDGLLESAPDRQTACRKAWACCDGEAWEECSIRGSREIEQAWSSLDCQTFQEGMLDWLKAHGKHPPQGANREGVGVR